MMKKEFEALAGYEVSFEDYSNIIEPMYMAIGASKQEFVKMLDKKRFALPTKTQLIKQMKQIAEHLKETCGRYTDYKAKDELDAIAREYARRFHGIDWVKDTDTYVIFTTEYEFPTIGRGCTYPKVLHIGKGYREVEKIQLVKEVQ